MYKFLLGLLLVSSFTYANECIDLSGTFIFLKGTRWEYKQVIRQDQCSEINLRGNSRINGLRALDWRPTTYRFLGGAGHQKAKATRPSLQRKLRLAI